MPQADVPDGKRVLPMLPSPPQFVRCPPCGHCHWLRDAPSCDDEKDTKAADRPPLVQAASESDIYRSLELATKRLPPERERELRILAWWRSNDAVRFEYTPVKRRGRASPGTPSPAERQRNLRALLALLSGSDITNTLMRAEIHRQSGEFEAARRQLAGITDARYSAVVRQFTEFCDAEDTSLRRLRLG